MDKTRVWAIVALFLIAVFAVVTVLAVGAWLRGPSGNWTPRYNQLDLGVIAWELGDDIVPYPSTSKKLDCDDAALYSYYWLRAVNEDLNIEIKKGWRSGTKFHVWLVVGNVTDSYIYDMGMAHQDFGYGRRVTFEQLIRFALEDAKK